MILKTILKCGIYKKQPSLSPSVCSFELKVLFLCPRKSTQVFIFPTCPSPSANTAAGKLMVENLMGKKAFEIT